MFAHRLLLLFAILATFVVLGCWDSRREVARVLEQGYPATAQITGAQYQRKMPLAVDGWRPRFVEQEIAVDLKWQGRDGKEHEYRKVPVTESFAHTIVSGDQVRLIPVGIKALDDDHSVPVIVVDAAPRLASLQSWSTSAGYMALAGWLGFAAMAVWRRRYGPRRGQVRSSAAAPAFELPPRRTMLGIGLLGIGAVLAFQAWSDQQAREAAMSGGTEIAAEILSVSTVPATAGGDPAYAVQLAWKDSLGAIRHFGPVAISRAFWQQITRGGELAVRQTTVRLREDDPKARPVIVADLPKAGWLEEAGMAAGLAMMVIGIGCLASALRSAARNG